MNPIAETQKPAKKRGLAIGLVAAVVILLPLAAFFYMSVLTPSISTKSYGPAKNAISFNSRNMPEPEVDNMAAGLAQIGFFDDKSQRSVFVRREGSTYVIAMAIADSAWTDADVVAGLNELRLDLQKLFPRNKIIFDLGATFNEVEKRLE